MTDQPSETLHRALNQIDRLRNRCVWITRFLIAASILFWCAADAMLLLRGNVAMGIVFGLITLWTAIFAVGINVATTSYANTLKVLNAIEELRRERRPPE